ncbi:Formamidopyrimidine-DNA glycosylase N-terminal domain-containing protein [Jackrogersella minutella]|nr:Formamidopyrimidine-DNA glycosylase N-terminal domain-containing protein [Jackrogersella minutella]
MPEIAEVARCVHFLRQHLKGKTIRKVLAPKDSNVFGKVGTSGPAFEKALLGKRVLEVGSQGKYFWMVLSSPPHPVMHLGMTGWVHIRGIQTGYTRLIKRTKGEQKWPPRYWKFKLETDSDPRVEVAYTDARRLGRIRLVDCPGEDIRKNSPLVENGPDPVIDKDVFTEEFLKQKMRSRHVSIKALLLNQATVSGIGNWVADEVLYQAKLHPEQYCDDFDDADVRTLYETIMYVCNTAVEKLGDSDQFPDDWLFKHRWGKGKKDSPITLPNGDETTHITVAGRTSCLVPAVQKKKEKRPRAARGEVRGDSAPEKVVEKIIESHFFEGKGKNKKQANDGKAEERPSKKAKTTESEPAKQEDEHPKLPLIKTSQKSSQKKGEEMPNEPPSKLGTRRSGRLNSVAA